MLVDAGADVAGKSGTGVTALHMALVRKDERSLTRRALDLKAVN